jgi:alpha-L-fucosidase
MGYYYSLYEWFNPLWLADRKRFVDEHLFPQFKDLVTKYKPSLIFSDGEWDMSDTAWKSADLLAWLFNESPVANEVVVNDRWGKDTRGKNKSTYTTSEYGSGMNADVIWEENQGIGHSYGYNRNEKLEDYKSSHDLILILVDVVSRGGNLLLDIGPTADGRIPVIMQQRLIDIGDWLKINGEAIYGTRPYKQPYQWSAGGIPKKSDKNYMAGYSVANLADPKREGAHIEAFFTTKGKDLYAVLPVYSSKLVLKNFKAASGASATVLGSEKKFPLKVTGNDTQIDLSGAKPGEIPSHLLTIKITGGPGN